MKLRPLFPSDRAAAGRGFTLVELLVVITIMAILISFSVPAFNAIGQAHKLTTGGEVVVAQLNLGRQHAITLNRPVELRFYQTPDPVTGQDEYNCVQLLSLLDDGSLSPLGGVARFPEGVIISSEAELSPLLSNAGVITGQALLGGEGGEAERDYTAFRISPSARPTLAGTFQDTFVTVLFAVDAVDESAPANFITIQVNPGNSTVRIYRP
jgi:uncharacterized protein (TIGR02596 family)